MDGGWGREPRCLALEQCESSSRPSELMASTWTRPQMSRRGAVRCDRPRGQTSSGPEDLAHSPRASEVGPHQARNRRHGRGRWARLEDRAGEIGPRNQGIRLAAGPRIGLEEGHCRAGRGTYCFGRSSPQIRRAREPFSHTPSPPDSTAPTDAARPSSRPPSGSHLVCQHRSVHWAGRVCACSEGGNSWRPRRDARPTATLVCRSKRTGV